MTRLPRGVAWLLTIALLGGCSQTRALAPVGGNRLAEVRFAANDVLVTGHVEILSAPVCSASGAADADISCRGTTLDNQSITVTSTARDQATLDVTVGSRSLYHGPLMSVLTANARPTP